MKKILGLLTIFFITSQIFAASYNAPFNGGAIANSISVTGTIQSTSNMYSKQNYLIDYDNKGLYYDINNKLLYNNLGWDVYGNNGLNIMTITSTSTVNGNLKFGGLNTTGAGTALLGTNCPADTSSAPYTWIKVLAADNSVCYIPVWK